ncbi:MAG: tetratricopeptide repeat protein [Gammaproteobacteria bacterium]
MTDNPVSPESSPPPSGPQADPPSPPAADPPPPSDAPPKKVASNLSHFPKRRLAPRGPAPMADSEDDDGGSSFDGERVFGVLKKLGIVILVLAVIVPIAGGLAWYVPKQIARSKAFAAYEKGNFGEALRELRSYIESAPNDNEAAYYAALAAMKTDDYAYAALAMQKIAAVPSYAQNPDFLFNYALALLPAEKTMEVLNNLASADPQHAGGRMMRGIMLIRENNIQRAREDFLAADNILRDSPDYDGKDLFAVHRRVFAKAGKVLPAFFPPSALSPETAALRPIAARLHIPIPAEIYINRYFPSPPEPRAQDFGADGLVGFYYALVLLQNGQLKEADVEFSKLPSSPAVNNLKAIQHALKGEYDKAEELLMPLAKEYSDNPQFLVNMANAQFNARPDTENAAKTAALLAEALAINNAMPAALHNRAVLRLATGNDSGALEDTAALNKLELAGATLPGQTPLLRVFAALAANPKDGNLNRLLSEVKASDVLYARVAHYTAVGRHDDALRLLRDVADKREGGSWNPAAQAYAKYLTELRLLMRARLALRARAPASNPEIRYRRGVLELETGLLEEAQKTLAHMEKANAGHFYTDALRGMAAYAGGSPEQGQLNLTMAIENAGSEQKRLQLAMNAAEYLAKSPILFSKILDSIDYLTPKGLAVRARLLAQSNPNKAAAIARDVLLRHPLYDVQYHAGLALIKADEYDDGLAALLAAVEWNPADIELLTEVKEIQAEGNLRAAAEIGAKIEGIRRENALEEEDSPGETPPIAQPKDPQLVRHIQAVFQTSGTDRNNALRDTLSRFSTLVKGVKSGPKKSQFLFQRASFYLAIKDYSKSENDFRDAIIKLPAEQKTAAKFYLAKALSDQKRHEAAAEVYRDLADLNLDSPLYRRLAGRAMSNYDPLGAEEYLMKAVERFPADIEGYFELSAARQKEENMKGAVTALQKAARISPLYVTIYTKLAGAQRSGDPKTATENSSIARNFVAQ